MLTNVPLGGSGLSSEFLFFVESIATIGMVIAVLLLFLIIFIRVRFIQVERHGFLIREEEERAKHFADVQAAKNPRWEMVTGLASSPNDSDWRRAIIEADIMLASLLTERGYAGGTLGDQLKSANPLQFTTLNLAWEAHKMRNAIAHLGDAFPLSERDVQTTVDQYRRVFEEFDYI